MVLMAVMSGTSADSPRVQNSPSYRVTQGRTRNRSMDVTNPRTNKKLTGRSIPYPDLEVDLAGGPQRPRVRVETTPEGLRDYVIRAYHAQAMGDPELSLQSDPDGRMLHAGTMRAARNRISEVSGYNSNRKDLEVTPKEHRLYQIEARIPEDEAWGMRRPYTDPTANELGDLRHGQAVSRSTLQDFPEEVEAAARRKIGAIGYKNLFEDPGSVSWAISPERVTRIQRLYDLGSSINMVKGLYDMVAQFSGGRMPMLNTPADWVFQDAFRNTPDNPYTSAAYNTVSA